MRNCLICRKRDHTVIATEIREGTGRIVQCNNCNLVFQDIEPSYEEIQNYYNEKYQITNSLTLGQEQSPADRFRDKLKTLDTTLGNILPLLTEQMSVLEVGCGTGELLYSLKSKVKNVLGVELNKKYSDFMNNELGIETYGEDINNIGFGGKKFDLIICLATLDHLADPLKTLIAMKDVLSPSGKLYIEVPNRNEALNYFLCSKNKMKFNKFFWHYAHLYYFTKETIENLFNKAGLKMQISCYHKYTLNNFLNWYYCGQPQSSFIKGATDSKFFNGRSDFEMSMNELLLDVENEFKKIMSKTFRGDTLCCTGWIK